jgi:heme oxygenase (biliverdin-IX-beta and delta-forming)
MQTEALMPSAALTDGTLNLQQYTQLLCSLYVIHHQIENYMAGVLLPYPTLAAFCQKKLPWLTDDLMALGATIPDVPAMGIIPPSTSEAYLVGMLYVLEGSMLGGQVILKGLRKNAELSHLPHRYYTGNGQLTGARWKAFIQILEETVSLQELESAVNGANFAFSLFLDNLSGSDSEVVMVEEILKTSQG